MQGLCELQKDDWALVDDGLNHKGSQYHNEGGTEGKAEVAWMSKYISIRVLDKE